MCLCPTQIHAQDHVCPILCLGTACARLNIDERVSDVMLAAEHAPKFQATYLLLEARKVIDEFFDRAGVIFFQRHLQQFVGIGKAGCQRIKAENDLFQQRPFPSERLSAIRLIPDIGLFQFPLDFSQALSISFVVKDTPLTPKYVRLRTRFAV
jgi:hypothetical protein